MGDGLYRRGEGLTTRAGESQYNGRLMRVMARLRIGDLDLGETDITTEFDRFNFIFLLFFISVSWSICCSNNMTVNQIITILIYFKKYIDLKIL